MAFNERLRQARIKAQKTQAQMADMLGVAKSTYSGYETGNSEPPMNVIADFMRLLHVSPEFLWQDEVGVSNARVIPYDEAQETLRIILTEDEYEELTLYQGAEPVYQEVVKDVLRAHQREKKKPL